MQTITVEVVVNRDIQTVWKCFVEPASITQWAFASYEWHCSRAENDVRVGGKFLTRMEAKDGSQGFDFTGTYTEVRLHEKIAYTMDDGRKVVVTFETIPDQGTRVREIFDPETINSPELQHAGWQSILDTFKKYTESVK